MPKKSVKKTVAAKKTSAKKAVVKKTVAKKVAVKKTVTKKKIVTKKAVTKKMVAKKSNAAKKSVVKKVVKKVTEKAITKTNKPKFTYIPNEGEKYMGKRQLNYFEQLFANMRSDILANNERLIDAIKDDVQPLPDENDRASKESEFTVELRERERERRLLEKVDSALQRVLNKNFGYCSECADPIGLQRLLARPVATLCIECKNLQEAFEKSGATNDRRH